MSFIASKWAYSQDIKSPTSKNILAFIASHNFPGNKVFFSVQTISGATAFSRRAVIDSLKWLVENKFLLKEIRIGENGGQQSNIYTLNIPSAYVEEYCSDYTKLSTPPVQELHPPRAGAAPPPVQELHPNINIINNNINKKLLANAEQKKNKAVENKKTRKDWKQENEKKHSFTDPKQSPRADVTNQSTSWKAEEHQAIQHSPEAVEKAMMSLPRHMRPKRYRDANPDDDKTKATELPAGTAVQSEIPSRSLSDEQGAANDVDRGETDSPPVRGSNRLMEARGVHSYLEEAGMAGTH